MNRELDGKVALVTGASRGIGRAVAVRLAADGAHVLLNYVSNEAAAAEALEAVQAGGGSGELRRFDVASGAEVQAAVEGILAQRGRLDILVNNAGIAIDGLLVRTREEDFERMMAVNLRSVYTCSRAVVRPMMKQRSGRIVSLTSVVGEAGNAGQSGYAATKAGIIGFTRSLAQELGSRSITVNAVSPGLIETDMTARLPAEAKEAMLRQIPLGRAGTAADVAEAVAFLCSERASYVTGQVLRVNGGMYM